MARTPVLGRPSDSRNRIVSEFRDRIVAGELNPGSRFPTHVEIEQQFGVSALTVQRALECLRYDGFIRVNGRQGTFVVDNPPHLSRYAVVFNKVSTEKELGQFLSAIVRELEVVGGQNPECQLIPYYEVDGQEGSEDFVRLRREVENHSIAGLIFTNNPYQLADTPLLDEPNIPRVAIMFPHDTPIPVVMPDTNSFLVRALDYLKEQGHRKIAFINNHSGLQTKDTVYALLAERGMETRSYWYQVVDTIVAEAARNCAELLMQCRDLPDALVICDDNLVEYATAGLADTQANIPACFSVIAHANFPYPTPCQFSARRLGFDIPHVLQLCVDNIDAQRGGEVVPSVIRVAANFEEEVVIHERVPYQGLKASS